jgi:16S rRNA (cytidine1402-2'-O)-methyltransferase
VVEPSDGTATDAQQVWWESLSIEQHVAHYEERNGGNRKEAMKQAAGDRNVSRRDIYNALL